MLKLACSNKLPISNIRYICELFNNYYKNEPKINEAN
jgi:hypothetical protein